MPFWRAVVRAARDRESRDRIRPLKSEKNEALNACLNTIERLLQENVAVLREDIEKMKRLAQEFEQEVGVPYFDYELNRKRK